MFLKQVPVHPRDRLERHVRDQFDGLETIDYNIDTNISDLGTKKKSGKQIAARKIVRKYINFARRKPYQRPDKKVEEDIVFLKQVPLYPQDRLTRKARLEFDDLETVDYNNDTSINDLDTKKNYETQIAVNKIIKKIQNIGKKKTPPRRCFCKTGTCTFKEN